MKRILLATILAVSAFSAKAQIPKIRPGDPLPANIFVELAKAVNPAVVNVFTTYIPRQTLAQPYMQNDPLFEMLQQFMGGESFGPATPQESLGSGFIIRKDGLILTNNHVVDRADIIKVQISENAKDVYDAKIVGKDARTDIAVIKINAKRKLPFLTLGSSAKTQVGEWVAAFGNPYGYGHSMTKGIVSAKGREIDALNIYPFMQVDAAIEPGNSGGPLVNIEGKVIGINTAIDKRTAGNIGFAIPIDNVKQVLPQLEKYGSIKRGFIGVGLADINEDAAASLHLNRTDGALVTQVVRHSPAQRAGVRPYDLIVGFNGKPITSSHDLEIAVAATVVGKTVPLKVIRDRHPITLRIRVGTQSKRRVRHRIAGNNEEGIRAPYHLGFAVANYNSRVRREFGLPALNRRRPVVVMVEGGSPAAQAGLAPGDVILDVNRKPARHARDVLRKLKRHSINVMRVLKRDRVVLISLRP